MARQHIESWLCWIIVDAIGIGLYFAKEIKIRGVALRAAPGAGHPGVDRLESGGRTPITPNPWVTRNKYPPFFTIKPVAEWS